MPKRKGENANCVENKKPKELVPKIGDILAEIYMIDEKLGAGTSGMVYSATNTKTGLRVAIKINRWRYTQEARE